MRIALAGFGVVGRALAQLLADRAADLRANHALEPRLIAVRDARSTAADPRGLDPLTLLATKADAGAVATPSNQPIDPAHWARTTHADVYIDTTPTNLRDPRPALDAMLAAFASGKHVISANKAPLAVAMPVLLESARYNRRQLRFSGTVGAGTPVLATARTLASGDTITSVQAVINGTTNFILWLMATERATFADALAKAQALGYAEADPGNDVDGLDTAMKLVILANHAMNRTAAIDHARITGIRGVTAADIAQAALHNTAIKLIATAHPDGSLTVAPTPVPVDDPLNVPRNLNAVRFTLASGNQPTLIGRGAGGIETATAILRDLLDIHASRTENHPC